MIDTESNECYCIFPTVEDGWEFFIMNVTVTVAVHVLADDVEDNYGVTLPKGSAVLGVQYIDRYPIGVSGEDWDATHAIKRLYYLDTSKYCMQFSHLCATTFKKSD
eukprot:jgi/Tetstr1/456617/TSEL_043320.t1